VFIIAIRGASSNLWPTSDFDPQGISKIYSLKSSYNYETINKLFYEKHDFIWDFRNLSVTEKQAC
jgi:hypothetical protein